MSSSKNSLPIWRIANGWREILARIFEVFEIQFNVTPEWLINPTTQRRLKLDMLYPDIGLAVRLEGLRGKKSHRLSLEEEDQQRIRNNARIQVSQKHGIQLIIVNVDANKPAKVFQQIDSALSRSARHLKDNNLLAQIKTARVTASALSRKVSTNSQLGLYADLWDDRQYKITEPTPTKLSPVALISYTTGMEVEHTIFGPGVVLSTTLTADDTLITVDFISVGQKTLAASLVADKLLPR